MVKQRAYLSVTHAGVYSATANQSQMNLFVVQNVKPKSCSSERKSVKSLRENIEQNTKPTLKLNTKKKKLV